MINIRALYPMYCSDRGVGHICMSLCEQMQGPGLNVLLTVPSTEPVDRRQFIRDVVPLPLRTLACRRPLRSMRHWATERQFVRRLRPGEIAYIWPGTSVSVYEQVKALGHTLLMERINCHRATARRILDEAYARLDWPAAHGITQEATDEEQRKLEIADYVFCPSPLVRRSMLDAGVPARKLLEVSFGWDPRRLAGHQLALPANEGLTVIFVGLACVRKGVHLLLRAWERARIKGRLVIMGHLAPDIERGCARQLDRPDVTVLGHLRDVAGAYRSADVFAFPTLEEGGPLVSYEAMACGLPVLTTPMGAGEMVRHGQEGIILEPYAEDAWVEALLHLASDAEFRRHLGRNGRTRAQDYTWAQVGRRRRERLLGATRESESRCIETAASR